MEPRDLLSFDKSLPRHTMLDHDETLRRLPGLLDKDLQVIQSNNEFSRCLGYTLDKNERLNLAQPYFQ